MAKIPTQKTVESIRHDDAKRKNIPTAEFQSVMKEEEQNPGRIAVKAINHLGDEVMKVRPFFPFPIIPERKNTPPFRTFPVPGGIFYFKKTFPTNIFTVPTKILPFPTQFLPIPTDIFIVPTHWLYAIFLWGNLFNGTYRS